MLYGSASFLDLMYNLALDTPIFIAGGRSTSIVGLITNSGSKEAYLSWNGVDITIITHDGQLQSFDQRSALAHEINHYYYNTSSGLVLPQFLLRSLDPAGQALRAGVAFNDAYRNGYGYDALGDAVQFEHQVSSELEILN